MAFQNTLLDQILTLQLTVARLGEKDLMNWWNLDVAQELGGADFLNRLVGPTMAPLSIADALLTVASAKEGAIMNKMPTQVFSLFSPPVALLGALRDRFRHYKRYPEDVPESVRLILDSRKSFTKEDLQKWLQSSTFAKSQGTSFGSELQMDPHWNVLQCAQALCNEIATGQRGEYPFAYYRGAEN